MAVDEAGLRARFAVTFSYTTGLRATELVAATTGRLRVRASAEAETAEDGTSSRLEVALRVVGKGAKVRDVPVAPELEALLEEYLAARGLPGWYECTPDRPLLSSLGAPAPGRAIATSSLYRMLRARFDALARTLNARQRREDCEAFERASMHWLRHTFGRHALADCASLNVVQVVLGHASIQTTTLYATRPAEQAHRELQGFARRRLAIRTKKN